MATQSRSEDLDVRRSTLGLDLREFPGRFDFFQMVRLLERLMPGRVPVGLFGPPDREVVRFGVNNSLAFPPSQIYSLDWPEGGQPKIIVNFFGLTGPMGVMPFAMTEFVRDRIRSKDVTLRDFFDMFNHRMISLFYQAWEKYRFFVGYERDMQDRFSKFIMSFVGLGTKGLAARQSVRDESLLFYSGLLSLQPRSATALEQIVSDYFGVPAEVEQFVGAWQTLSTQDQCNMDGEDFSEQLGVGAVAGDEIWSHQTRVKLRLGPLTIEQYLSFLPTGSASKPLESILRYFSGYELEYEVELVLRRDHVPPCELDARANSVTMLGWTTWMKSSPSFGRDPADAVLLMN